MLSQQKRVEYQKQEADKMKCQIIPVQQGRDVEPKTIAEVKLHRHTVEIHGLLENEAFELEVLLNRTKKIKVRRIGDG